jgi:hypothetical protein
VALALVLLTACASQPARPATPALVVVSGPSPFSCPAGGTAVDAEVEPSLAVDPSDPRHLVGAWQQDRDPGGGARGIVAAVSHDGGATWRTTSLPGVSSCRGGRFARVSDPVVGIGPDGHAYAVSLGVGGPEHRNAVLVSASADGGGRWGQPVTVHEVTQPPNFPDKPFLVADPRRRGGVLVAWSEYDVNSKGEAMYDRLEVSRSADGAATWSAPAGLHGDGHSEAQFALVAPTPDGLVATFEQGDPGLPADPDRHPASTSIQAVRSADGGATWSAPVTVATFPFTTVHDPGTGRPVRANGLMHGMAVDRDGSVYEAFAEDHQAGLSTVSVARSTDGGRTWQPPVVVVAGGGQAFLPQVAVDGSGAVAVLTYDFHGYRTGDASLETEVSLAVSGDHGGSWTSRTLAGPFDLRLAAPSSGGAFVGDYQGAVGLPSGFAFLFVMGPPAARSGATDVFFKRAAAPAVRPS